MRLPWLALLASGACAGFGSEIDPLLPDGGTGGVSISPASGGVAATGGVAASGGSVASGGSPAGGGGAIASGGASGAGGSTPAGGGASGNEACPTRDTFAILLTLDVTWAGNSATVGGTGVVRIWNKAELSASGDDIGGMVTPCGTDLPETTLSGLGRIAAGGNKILIQVPQTVWDQPTMPKFPLTGKRTGSAIGGMVTIDLVAPLGYERADVKGAWPDSYTELAAELKDPDGDGKPGYLALPRPDGGYVLPPTSLGVGGLAPAAERLALVSRNILTLTGTRTACEAFAGSATAHAFDSHVVGCVLRGGKDCSPSQVDFVDQNRMKYVPRSARFSAVRVAAGADCAEIRRVQAQ